MVAEKRVEKKRRAGSARLQEQEDARARLIDAAIALFADKGYEGTSVRDLASAAGVNVAAVSYHFGSKDALYTEALRACIREFLEMMTSPAARHSHLVMREQSEGKPRFEPVIREFFQPVGTILRELILLLAPRLPEMSVFMTISGIIGQ